MTLLLPSALKRSRFLFEFSAQASLAAAEQALTAVTGQAATFSRASTKTALDANGAVRIVPHSLPAFQWTLDPVSGLMTPGVLLEGARTNATIYSEQLDNAAWVKTEATVTANAATAPNGTLTADKLVESVTAAVEHYVDYPVIPAWTDSTTQSASIYVKAAGRTFISMVSLNKAGVFVRTWFNLTTGAVGTKNHPAASMTALTNGWYRCDIQIDAGVGATVRRVVVEMNTADNTLAYNGDGASGVYLWGAQHEVDKAFASSYIPTTTIAVARTADVLSWPFLALPQSGTLYVKGVWGSSGAPAAYTIVLGDAAASNASLLLVSDTASTYGRVTTSANFDSTVGTLPALGNTVEQMVQLTVSGGNGTTTVHRSTNGGTALTGAASASFAMPAAWSAGTLRATLAGSESFLSLQAVRFASSVQPLATMRSA